jgi:ATP-dependent helicase YprA (DUF1998 family)
VEAVCAQQRLVTLCPVPASRHANYYTKPQAYRMVDVTAMPAAPRARATAPSRCLVKVTTAVQGILAIDARSGHSTRVDSLKPALYTGEQALPGVVWTVSLCTLRALVALPCHPLAAIHAAAHALLRIMPLHLLCDASDLDTEHGPSHLCTRARPSALVLYEPVECGLAAAACARAPALLQAARHLLLHCPCASGCGQCLLTRSCGHGMSKAGALLVLEALLGGPEGAGSGT